MFASVMIALLALAWLPFRPSDPFGVDVRIDGQTSAGTDALLRSTVRTVLVREIPDLRLATRWDRVPRFQAALTAAFEGDSLWFSGTVTDRFTKAEYAIAPASRRAVGPTADVVAEQIAVAIAAARSPLTQRWAAKATLPRTLAAFRLFEAALRDWRPPFNAYPTASLGQLTRASELDSTSGSPIALRALILGTHGYLAAADSTLTALQRPGVRTGAWDRGISGVVRAWIAKDIPRAHRAGHELLDAVPGSEWAVVTAYDALGLGYAREAVSLLRQMTPLRGGNGELQRGDDDDEANPEAMVAWKRLNLTQAFSLLGAFDSALAVSRQTLSRYPDDRIASQNAIKALAGLGRAAEIEQICRRVLGQKLSVQECQQGIIELRGRGQLAAARRVADMLLESLAVTDTISAQDLDAWKAFLATRAGDWTTAGTLLQSMSWSELEKQALQMERLIALGLRGDSAAVQQGLTRLEGKLDVYEQAEIAAMLGDMPRATALVAEGFRRGRRRNITLFMYPGLDPLRDYPPFLRLMAPLDVADHRVAHSTGEAR